MPSFARCSMLVVSLATTPLTLPAQQQTLGEVSFANTGSRAAQPDFLRGLALLHSFMYGPSADAFRRAQRVDSTFAMAYWGEAMTYIHTAWRQENLVAANAALDRLGASRDVRIAKAGSPRERMYGAAIEALVAKGASESQRVHGFADTMLALARTYPRDLDARSFASLGLMNVNYLWPAADSAQRASDHDVAEALAIGVFRESPRHPGGVHYVIHVNDDPVYAKRGLVAARAYAKVAPDADHALHMPSHIFVQLGLWDEATRSNERSWPASRAMPMSHGDEEPSASWHSLQWLQYSYLQQGRWRAARALIDTARAILKDAPSDYWNDVDARFVLSDLIFRYATETGEGWAAVGPAVAAEGSDTGTPRGATFTANAAYHAALAGVMTGDTALGRAYVQRIRSRDTAGVAPQRRARDELAASQVEALIATSRGDTTAALAAWDRAIIADEAISPLGPPALVPTHEWLGSLQLRRGNAAAAVKSYTRALERRPNRAAALLGLARAQRAAGDRAAAERTYRKLTQQWHSADKRPPLIFGA
ncbi:MAG: tetratricopeptide repeat protein [bacterium]